MNVVYCVTADYIEKIQPSIRSLKEHNPKAKIYVVTETNKAENADVTINVSDQQWFPKNGVNYNNQFTHIGLLKICYPYLIKADKVIHLDADTIVCDSLKPMWDVDLTGKWFAMCDEKLGRYHPFGKQYWNAGVMVLNLKQMRKDNIMPDMIDYLNKVRQPWCEQDAFNFRSKDKVVELPTRFNECFATGYTDDPAIVHYAAVKDWWTSRTMKRHEYIDRYR